jgi:hypothetical protein
MDNQHRKIVGYRELSENEIARMNEIKEFGRQVGELVQAMEWTDSFDQRWVEIGRVHLQQGLMALTRAVARPEFF